MPTDVALVLTRKARLEAKESREKLSERMILCLWIALGLLLTAAMSNQGLDPAAIQYFVTDG